MSLTVLQSASLFPLNRRYGDIVASNQLGRELGGGRELRSDRFKDGHCYPSRSALFFEDCCVKEEI